MSTAPPPPPVTGVPEPVPPPSKLRALWKGWPGSALRVVLALLPLVWLTQRVRWSDVAARARDVGVEGLSLSFGTLLVSVMLSAARWREM